MRISKCLTVVEIVSVMTILIDCYDFLMTMIIIIIMLLAVQYNVDQDYG